MSQHIGAIIQEWLRSQNLDDKLQQKSIPGYWIEIVGETVAKHAEVERVEQGKMYIRVESATWRNEVMLRREEIRAKVNAHLGAEIVKEVIVR